MATTPKTAKKIVQKRKFNNNNNNNNNNIVLRARKVLYKMHLLPQLKALKVSHAQYYVMSETSAALETFFVRELFL